MKLIITCHYALATKIIKEQEAVIGPLAWSEAGKIKSLNVEDHKINIKDNGKQILEALVNQYATLFGQASIEVCKDAIRNLITDIDRTQLPKVLLP